MAHAGQTPQQLAQSLIVKVKTLFNADLKEICRNESLPVSGIKVTLQKRIIEYIEGFARKGNAARLEVLRHRIENRGMSPTAPNVKVAPTHQSGKISLNANALPTANGYPGPHVTRPPPNLSRIIFRESPFYEVIEPLGGTLELLSVPAHRSTVHMTVYLSLAVADRLALDQSFRVMLYCSAEIHSGPFARSDIAFPQQVEVKVNDQEVKANFKGLKNRVGSTRPADLTAHMQKAAGFANRISITYALTHKKYYLVPQLVRKHSAGELAQQIRRGRVITRQKVVNEMVSKANDPDIVAVSTVMSLKDPVSTLRIRIPCRSMVCTHNQCFDVESFLQLQEQAPTWVCPVCNKTISFAALAVDQYVQDILSVVAPSIDQVTIEPDGSWSSGTQTDATDSAGAKNHTSGPSDDYYGDDSDDLVEISDYRVKELKKEAPNTPTSFNRTPPTTSSREASTNSHPGSAHRQSTSSKRTSEVIDLTLSSEDDEPQRPIKKPAYHHGNNINNNNNPPATLAEPTRSNGGSLSFGIAPTPRSNGVVPFRIGNVPKASMAPQSPSPNLSPVHPATLNLPPHPHYP